MSVETDFMHRERRKKLIIGLSILGVALLLVVLTLLVGNPITN